MAPKKATPREDSTTTPTVQLSDPWDDLRKAFTDRTSMLQEDAKKANVILQSSIDEVKGTLEDSVKSNNRIITFVILVMALGFLTLIFALASVLITSWQASQSIHDALQSQTTNEKPNAQPASAPSGGISIKFTLF